MVCLLPLIFRSSFSRTMLSQMGIAILFALSYNMLLGEGGLLSFGMRVFLLDWAAHLDPWPQVGIGQGCCRFLSNSCPS